MAKVDVGTIIELVKQLEPIIRLFGTLFAKRQPPVVVPPAPGPVVPPNQPPLPQVPIDTTPSKTIAGVALRCTSVEKPQRVGGGPGVNYPDHVGMIQRGENFNYGCVSFWNGQARDQRGDEFLGPDLIRADLEFRTEYRVYRDGQLVAVMKGEGDDNPAGEGKPAPWHQSENAGVGFGVSRWLNSAGFDHRIVFNEEGKFEVEVVIGGVTSNRVAFNVS